MGAENLVYKHLKNEMIPVDQFEVPNIFAVPKKQTQSNNRSELSFSVIVLKTHLESVWTRSKNQS